MSRPSSSGESLEAILASIRRSLAEQATDVLTEEPVAGVEAEEPFAPLPDAGPAPAVDLDAPPVPQSVTEQLAAIVATDLERDGGTQPVAPVAAAPTPAIPVPDVLPLRESLRTPPPETMPQLAPQTMREPTPAAGVTSDVVASQPVIAPVDATGPAAAVASTPAAVPEPAAEPPMPVEAPAVAEASRAQAKEPLWFLAQEGAKPGPGEPSAGSRVLPVRPAQAARPPAQAEPLRPQAVEPPRAPEPKPQPRPGVLRGPLPPFFGSSVEAVKLDAAPDAPSIANGSAVLGGGPSMLDPMRDAMPPQAPVAGPSPTPAGLLQGMPRVAPGEAERRAAPVGPIQNPSNDSPDGWPRAAEPSAPASKPGGLFGAMPGDAGVSPQLQALEVMVAELLRPMLRRWLDENMPRLVSAALKAEAQLLSERDRKKS